MMRALMMMLALSLLGGCGLLRPVVKEPEIVKVPVAVGCEPKVVPLPMWPVDALPSVADIYTQTAALVTEIVMREAYEAELRGALADCAQQSGAIEKKVNAIAAPKKSWAERAREKLGFH